ncbi:MAG: GntR family transcriptional regulator [Provencibacterium sp.]|jgi:GntR family transcriptional regulator|nr:GntR family transcriptional regulator [Provencibacterium sp.]
MTWDFKGDRPIYIQLMEEIQMYIVSGQYPAGSKLPAVRDLAAEASVNPNTMQKALAELERDGLLHTQRTAGRFITEDQDMIRGIREKLAREQVDLFFEKMGQLGISREETLLLLQKAADEPQQEKESA